MATDQNTATPPAEERSYDQAAKPIWEIFEDGAEELSEDDIRKIPTYAAEQLDHYLYGTPKKI